MSFSGKEYTCQFRRHSKYKFHPGVRKIPWRREWQPTPVFFPGEFHGQRSLAGPTSWSHKESDMTKRLTHSDDCKCTEKKPWIVKMVKQILNTPKNQVSINLSQLLSWDKHMFSKLIWSLLSLLSHVITCIRWRTQRLQSPEYFLYLFVRHL